MKVSRHQLLAIIATSMLVLVFYFGCETKDPKMKLAEKSRAASFENTSIENIKKVVFDSLDANNKAYFDGLQLQLRNSFNDSTKIEALKSISGFWYNQGEYAMAGEAAEEIADIVDDAFSWSMAGTSYAAGIKNGKSDSKRTFNMSKAVIAFESAISLEPENINHKVNLAICYAENPPADQPMTGILMLLDLDKENPNSPSVLFQLARFGMQTNQFDKAIGRLKNILEIDPTMIKAHCLLADALTKTNKQSEAEKHVAICKAGRK